MKGFIILCSFFTIEILASWSLSYLAKLKLSEKLSFDLNILGIRKLRRLHSSLTLFISGVPVSKNLAVEYSFLEFSDTYASSFLSLWASSKKIIWKSYFYKSAPHIFRASYVVTHTSNFPGFILFFKMSSRCSIVGFRLTTFKNGVHLANSLIQFAIVDLGATIKWGSFIFEFSCK